MGLSFALLLRLLQYLEERFRLGCELFGNMRLFKYRHALTPPFWD